MGASRILYRPLDNDELKEALKAYRKARKSTRRKAPEVRSQDSGLSRVRERNSLWSQYRYWRAWVGSADDGIGADEFRIWRSGACCPAPILRCRGTRT